MPKRFDNCLTMSSDIKVLIVLLRPLPISSFSFAPVVFTAKKEGAIPCRGSGEAVGCPVRTTEEDAP